LTIQATRGLPRISYVAVTRERKKKADGAKGELNYLKANSGT
jgi:hypothetical protein